MKQYRDYMNGISFEPVAARTKMRSYGMIRRAAHTAACLMVVAAAVIGVSTLIDGNNGNVLDLPPVGMPSPGVSTPPAAPMHEVVFNKGEWLIPEDQGWTNLRDLTAGESRALGIVSGTAFIYESDMVAYVWGHRVVEHDRIYGNVLMAADEFPRHVLRMDGENAMTSYIQGVAVRAFVGQMMGIHYGYGEMRAFYAEFMLGSTAYRVWFNAHIDAGVEEHKARLAEMVNYLILQGEVDLGILTAVSEDTPMVFAEGEWQQHPYWQPTDLTYRDLTEEESRELGMLSLATRAYYRDDSGAFFIESVTYMNYDSILRVRMAPERGREPWVLDGQYITNDDTGFGVIDGIRVMALTAVHWLPVQDGEGEQAWRSYYAHFTLGDATYWVDLTMHMDDGWREWAERQVTQMVEQLIEQGPVEDLMVIGWGAIG
ncbi:MAG: hypothetical protein FWE06_06830 [Oscillospiraceae bacterium]|nr:hypothetical protein [Oscillospiraceae bacterium]